jgi:ribosomal protein S18 acetylase RimI-like enzyme
MTADRAVRPPAPADVKAALSLFSGGPEVSRYFTRAREIVQEAAAGRSEHLAFATTDGAALSGMLLCTVVAGTEGTASITALSVKSPRRRRGLGTTLVNAACEALRRRGCRLVIAELPDDPAIAAAHRLLEKCRFTESGRIPQFYAERIAMIIYERRLAR